MNNRLHSLEHKLNFLNWREYDFPTFKSEAFYKNAFKNGRYDLKLSWYLIPSVSRFFLKYNMLSSKERQVFFTSPNFRETNFRDIQLNSKDDFGHETKFKGRFDYYLEWKKEIKNKIDNGILLREAFIINIIDYNRKFNKSKVIENLFLKIYLNDETEKVLNYIYDFDRICKYKDVTIDCVHNDEIKELITYRKNNPDKLDISYAKLLITSNDPRRFKLIRQYSEHSWNKKMYNELFKIGIERINNNIGIIKKAFGKPVLIEKIKTIDNGKLWSDIEQIDLIFKNYNNRFNLDEEDVTLFMGHDNKYVNESIINAHRHKSIGLFRNEGDLDFTKAGKALIIEMLKKKTF